LIARISASVVFLAACGGASHPDGVPDAAQREAWLAALKSGACETVTNEALRDDCWLARVAHHPEVCEKMAGETARSECWFRVAEAQADPSLCPKAGIFAEDCALHVLSTSFASWVPRDARPGAGEDEVERRIAASGLAADDPRPWSAYYRWILGQQHPLDRASCAAATTEERRDACAHTGLALYADLLNHARDRRTFPCDGGPMPPELQTTPDPEIDALVASRTDLCPK
jgi:hypothetical protein